MVRPSGMQSQKLLTLGPDLSQCSIHRPIGEQEGHHRGSGTRTHKHANRCQITLLFPVLDAKVLGLKHTRRPWTVFDALGCASSIGQP